MSVATQEPTEGFRSGMTSKLPRNRFSEGTNAFQSFKELLMKGFLHGQTTESTEVLPGAKNLARSEVKQDADTMIGRAGQDVNLVGVMLTIGIAAVVGYAVIFASSETESSIDVTANSGFDNASTSLTSGLESAFSLVEVAFIALILVVVIGAFLLLQARRR